MSHVVTVDFTILDLNALAQAATESGLELVLHQSNYRWFGRSVGDYHGADASEKHGIAPDGKCEHAIRVRGDKTAYEIGVVKNPNGPGFRLVWDFYNRGYGLSKYVSRHAAGTDLELLQQRYSAATIKREAMLRRRSCVERRLHDGSIQLTVDAPE